jgi:hypothetical protein
MSRHSPSMQLSDAARIIAVAFLLLWVFMTIATKQSSQIPDDIDEFFSTEAVTLVKEIVASDNCEKSIIENSGVQLINCGVIRGDVYVLPTYEKGDKRINYVLTVLPIDLQWVKGMSDAVGDEVQSKALTEIQESLGNEAWAQLPFRRATDIITIGLASNEMVEGMSPEEGLAHEKRRSEDRAANLYKVIYPIVPEVEVKNMYTLSLGKYVSDACSIDKANGLTSYQRPVLIVSIVGKSESVDQQFITDALKKQFEKFGTASIDYNCYSGFDLNQLQRTSSPQDL